MQTPCKVQSNPCFLLYICIYIYIYIYIYYIYNICIHTGLESVKNVKGLR